MSVCSGALDFIALILPIIDFTASAVMRADAGSHTPQGPSQWALAIGAGEIASNELNSFLNIFVLLLLF
jgi:hypothetical protein